MTLVLVDRAALEDLIDEAWGNERCYASTLEPSDPVCRVAVQAGIPLPGPMQAGTVPPPPMLARFMGGVPTAATYRAEGDVRLRCEQDAKVVYTSMEQAQHAAHRISERTPMQAYFGACGHFHVARIKSHG